MLEFRLLGTVEAEYEGRPLDLGRRRERCLLGILLLELAKPVPVERLVDLLWDDDPPDAAIAQLRVNVSRIRARFRTYRADDTGGTGFQIVTRGNTYMAIVDPDSVDLHRFRALVDRARTITDPAQRAAVLETALGLWRGPVLGDVASHRLRERITAGFEEMHLSAVELLLEAKLAAGRHRELIGRLVELVDQYPLRQRLVGLLMLALYRDRRQPEAIAAYERLRGRLAEELGLDPDEDTRRLHEAILRADPALDFSRQLTPPAQLPVGIHGFVGRREELDRLTAMLVGTGAGGVAIAVLTGTAGVGKTTLAVHFAHRVAANFPDGQLYVNLRGFDPGGSVMSAQDALRGFLDAFSVPAERVPPTFTAQLNLYRNLLAGRRMLILLDNVHDAEQVRPLLPGTPGCLVVVTSRNQLTELIVVEGARLLTVDLLSHDEARDLLTRRIGADRVSAEPRATDEIVDGCARLPLALAVVAARAAAHPRFRLAAFADELRQALGRLDALATGGPVVDVRAIFSYSYRTLTPAAARLFRLLAEHPGPDIAAPAVASLSGAPAERIRPLLAELTGVHLVTEEAPGRYGFHDLLRAYAAERAAAEDTDDDRRAAVHRYVDHYLHTADTAARLIYPSRRPLALPQPEPGVYPEQFAEQDQAVSWFAAEHQVLLAVQRRALDHQFHWHVLWLARAASTYLGRHGHSQDLIVMHTARLTAAQRLGDRSEQAFAHREIAMTYTLAFRYEEAQMHYQQTIALQAALDDQAGQADTHLYLSVLLDQLERYEEALIEGERALRLYQSVGDRTRQAQALNTIGWYHAQLGRHRQALTLSGHALARFLVLGDRHGQAATWDSLGYAHHAAGNYPQAMVCYRYARAAFRDVADRVDEAGVLTRLGETYLAAEQGDEARRVWQEALDILDPLHHPHADRVRIMIKQVYTGLSDTLE
jgi:DNA-binding SARP family transcriptional activator/tetratricopeptide (TPR) repeat protein